MMKYVIIGNSTAGIACIEGIRSADGGGEITVISEENRHCYGRPLISYQLLGRIKKENMDYRPRDFYLKNRVETLFGVRAAGIDPKAKKVILEGGGEVEYDRLLVAAGSRPFVPPAEGAETVERSFTFMSYSDMEALEAQLSPERNALIIGAGLIGLKCAEGILGRVKSVTVVDLAERVLPAVLDGAASAFVRAKLEEAGVKFILGDCVKCYNGGSALLKSGARVNFDILVTAAGVRPNAELVKDAGGAVNRGVLIDSSSRTSLPDIYAAGDCAEGYDITKGERRVLAILPNAYMQGYCAGVNMAGGKAVFDSAIPMNAVGFFDTHIITAGIYEGECIERVTPSSYKKLFIKDGRLAGYILIGDIARAGIYTSLIRGAVPLSEVDFGLLAESPQLMAFQAEARAKMLARRV